MTDTADLSNPPDITVQVVYALPEQQFVCEMQVPPGTTVLQAVARSGFLQRFPDLAEEPECAVFGLMATADQPLHPGDRVELLRPLLADPKVRRRESVAKSRHAGQRRR